MKPVLLVVDDDQDIRSQLKWALADEYDVVLAGDRVTALEAFAAVRPMVVLLDLGLPPCPSEPEEGLAALAELLAADSSTKVIIITGQSERENAFRAVGSGAYDLLCKPVDVDMLKLILKRAYYVAGLEREYRQIQRKMAVGEFEGMLGHSEPMQAVFDAIRKVSTTDVPVLILGESGTGKEMAALAIHRRSERASGPFVAINCSAIPETLLESELFGHEKGAFTGAHIQRKGRIESAHGGTLFLDEIGELPASLQVKLLRFLQDQVIERVGGRTQINVDTRIIAATNSDLKKAMQAGLFREDLYYRLAVVVIRMPPLRDRPGDIPLLANAFLKKCIATNGAGRVVGFSEAAIRAMENYPWPGNVRELENRVKRAVIMAHGKLITPADLELPKGVSAGAQRTLKQAREIAEREVILAALHRHKWKIAHAAAELDVSRPTLYELMAKYDIQRPDTEDS